MPTRRHRGAASSGRRAIELAVAVPQVVTHRLGRAALAGPSPSARDRREFQRMYVEKIAAFNESLNAMAIEMVRANIRAFFAPWSWSWPRPRRASTYAADLTSLYARTGLGMLDQALAPYHRRAVANATRLRRGRAR